MNLKLIIHTHLICRRFPIHRHKPHTSSCTQRPTIWYNPSGENHAPPPPKKTPRSSREASIKGGVDGRLRCARVGLLALLKAAGSSSDPGGASCSLLVRGGRAARMS